MHSAGPKKSETDRDGLLHTRPSAGLNLVILDLDEVEAHESKWSGVGRRANLFDCLEPHSSQTEKRPVPALAVPARHARDLMFEPW